MAIAIDCPAVSESLNQSTSVLSQILPKYVDPDAKGPYACVELLFGS
jgi:hypothetical protein